MKKFLATFGLIVVVALSTLGFAGSAQAVDYVDSGVASNGSPAAVDSAGATSGALPNTGGPQTALIVGGVALVAVGGTVLVVSRRRANA